MNIVNYLISLLSLALAVGIFVDYTKHKQVLSSNYSQVSLESHLFLKNEENFNKVVEMNVYNREKQKLVIGTGFYVNFKDKTYLLTNNHICDIASIEFGIPEEMADLYYTDNEGTFKVDPTKMVQYNKHDICLIGIFSKGSKFAFELRDTPPTKYMSVYSIGHPAGMDRLTQVGQFIQNRGSTMISGRDTSACNNGEEGSAYNNETLKTFFGELQICMFRSISSHTTLTGAGGSSGSPAHDANNKLVGVILSLDPNTANWMQFVPYHNVLDFLTIISSN